MRIFRTFLTEISCWIGFHSEHYEDEFSLVCQLQLGTLTGTEKKTKKQEALRKKIRISEQKWDQKRRDCVRCEETRIFCVKIPHIPTTDVGLASPSVYDCHAVTQAVSRRLPPAAGLVRVQVRPCGICGGQSSTEEGFLRALWFTLSSIPQTAPHSSSSIIIRGWYNRPVMTSVIVD
jgi:hypothetical protein